MASRQWINIQERKDFLAFEELEARNLLLDNSTKDTIGRHGM